MQHDENVFMEGAEIQAEIESISNTHGFRFDATYELLEQSVGDYINGTVKHLAKLKTRLNALVPINRLPTELLSRIILLTNSSIIVKEKHPYIPYTWVCHCWRCVVIHNPSFWTSIELEQAGEAIHPFVHELVKRSKSAELDIKLEFKSLQSVNSSQYIPTLAEFFTKESNRIRTVYLHAERSGPFLRLFAGKHFPVLRGFIQDIEEVEDDGLRDLVPCLPTWDNLETLDCIVWEGISVDTVEQLKPVFSRMRKLSLHISDSEALPSILDSLQNDNRLRTLRLQIYISPPPKFSSQTTLPELRFLFINDVSLLEAIHAPKLSGLDIHCLSPVSFKIPIIKEFEFSSIKYLHVFERNEDVHSILALKEPIYHKSVFSVDSGYFDEKIHLILEEMEELLDSGDILSDTWPQDYFRLQFGPIPDPPDDSDDSAYDYNSELPFETFTTEVEAVIRSFLPQLTGLRELCFASSILIERYSMELPFNKILTYLPSLEKAIFTDGSTLLQLIRLLGDISICPQLKHILYMAKSYYALMCSGEENVHLAEEAGQLLTEAIRSRQTACGDLLKFVAIGNCPRVSDNWHKELQKLDVTIVIDNRLERLHSSRTYLTPLIQAFNGEQSNDDESGNEQSDDEQSGNEQSGDEQLESGQEPSLTSL